MSVIHFDSHELGNVARALAESPVTPSHLRASALAGVASALSLVSHATAAAYVATYRDPAEPYTAAAIVAAARATTPDGARAAGTIGLLRYNCVANDGRDFASPAVVEAIGRLIEYARIGLEPRDFAPVRPAPAEPPAPPSPRPRPALRLIQGGAGAEPAPAVEPPKVTFAPPPPAPVVAAEPPPKAPRVQYADPAELDATTPPGAIVVRDVAAADTVRRGVRRPGRVDVGHHVAIVPGRSVVLFGLETNKTGGPKAYRVTFGIGDVAAHGGYNFTYTGRIVAIGKSTITIAPGPGDRNKRLDLQDFSFWNRDFDLAEIERERLDWRD